ncbi:stalk domain-containing protein [Peptococcaceae bacterium]|nr:stalk domain-containing protein [Peptococcaceae bacterium]
MKLKLLATFVVVCLLVSTIFVGQVEAKPPLLRSEDGYGYKYYEYYKENGYGYKYKYYYYEEEDGYGYKYKYYEYEREESVEKDVYEEDVHEEESVEENVYEEESIKEDVYGEKNYRHRIGLLRAYENVSKNPAAENAQRVLLRLIECIEKDSITEKVYAVASLATEENENIEEDENLKKLVTEEIYKLKDDLLEEEKNNQELSKLLNKLADAFLAINKKEQAEEYIRRALEINPKDLESYRKLVEVRSEKEKVNGNLVRVEMDKAISVFAKGREVKFDVPPRVVENRTMVPIRQLGEIVGGSFEHNRENRKVVFISKDKEIVIYIDKEEAFINEKPVPLDVSAMIIDGRTLVPLRFVGEALDFDVDYLEEEDMGLVILN